MHVAPDTRRSSALAILFFGCLFIPLPGAGQTAPAHRDFEAEITATVRAATIAADRDFPLTVLQLCHMSKPTPLDTTDVVPPGHAGTYSEPPRERWYVEPARAFDNLYFVGDLDQSAWALTTPEGIVLFDTNIPSRTESVILEGMRKLGLDPKHIRYVLVSHAHRDHIGGAVHLQERFGARIVMSEPDWDLVARYPRRYATISPRRDVVAVDGGTITLGGTAIRTWLTPGHTSGTLSFTFPVLDRGKQLNVVYSGGTGFNFPNDTPELGIPAFQIYIDSQRRLAEKAASTGATVFLTNHSWNDNAVNKIRMIAGRGTGPNPFEIGASSIQRYFQTTGGCARAAQLRLEQRRSSSASSPHPPPDR